MTQLVQGVGINDASYPVRPKSSRDKPCPYYMRWSDMLKRCYSEQFRKQRPTYEQCTVCDEWVYFTNFKQWMKNQEWEGNQLDKDILILDNKVYSPETCLFVPLSVNNFFKGLKTNAVYYDIDRNKYRVSINNKFIGRYDSEEQALIAYGIRKLEEQVSLAMKQKPEIKSAIISNALQKHKIDQVVEVIRRYA